MGNIIVKIWRGEAGLFRAFLFIPLGFLSLIYRGCLAIRESLFRTGMLKVEKAHIPVVSVGNITVGGTGKTPVVELLSKRLKQRGFSPGIVTRGYKRKRGGVFAVDAKADDAASVGDEALMLAKKTGLPVIVGKKRIQAVEVGVKKFGIDLAVLDDGYQVRDLKKDLDVLVISGFSGTREGDLFPLGPYREPLDMIRKAGVILVSRGELSDGTKMHASGIPTFRLRYRPTFLYNVKRDLIGPCTYLEEKNVLAFAGLGNNRSFFESVKELGADVVHTVEFPDHHTYTAADIARLLTFKDAEMLVTTEKDAVKLNRLPIPENLFYLAVEAVVEREEEFIEFVVRRLGGKDVN
ncbi:MAG TPA: tetraacyldisaccharide 4'-kinase [Syntrophorhabdales bacterium]|nr:tetraacyldisaccharide 4'-kinase [Syntrophorhabdales bacterium]